jgi:urocanate hydratase
MGRGYYPAGLSFEDSNRMISEDPEDFRDRVQASLRRQVDAINFHAAQGMYFFDYGNAFLLEASRPAQTSLHPKVNSDILPMYRILWPCLF